MFNVFTYDKQLSKTQQFEKIKDKFVKDEPERRRTQSRLAASYKKRVETFVLQMSEKPIITHDFVPAVVKIRDEDPAKFLGPSNMIIRSFKHEKDRIKENIEAYKKMQTDYISHQFEFRKRDVHKEIQPMMRFTSKTNFERVANRLKVLMQDPQHLDPRLFAKGTENLSESFILELSKSPQATNKYLAKHLLPELNSKTHFKAAHSLYLGIPDVLMDQAQLDKVRSEKAFKKSKENNEPSSPRKLFKGGSKDLDLSDLPNSKNSKDSLPVLKHSSTTLRIDEDEKHGKDFEKQIHIETLNPVDVSKKVLMKCNVIKPKREGTSPLPKGGGHLMSMSDRNLKQIYHELYHKNLE